MSPKQSDETFALFNRFRRAVAPVVSYEITNNGFIGPVVRYGSATLAFKGAFKNGNVCCAYLTALHCVAPSGLTLILSNPEDGSAPRTSRAVCVVKYPELDVCALVAVHKRDEDAGVPFEIADGLNFGVDAYRCGWGDPLANDKFGVVVSKTFAPDAFKDFRKGRTVPNESVVGFDEFTRNGDSGGPIIDATCGRLVGITVEGANIVRDDGKTSRLTFGVRIDRMKNFLFEAYKRSFDFFEANNR